MHCNWILKLTIYAFIVATALILPGASVEAQEPQNGSPTQTIRGRVVNLQTQQPVGGATVAVLGTKLGAFASADGAFVIRNVPVRRHRIRVTSVGYDPLVINVVLTSGKEEILTLELLESFVEVEEVEVTANASKFEAINEAALVSTTMFSLDDVEKYAGSLNDPARMAQNFAGVVGASDQRNDIIIRGGAPTELLWRLDGLDIPNPNHYAAQGGTGGPVNTINTILLDDSDFLTGAFPVQYGDRLSGVFDLRTRSGNNERYEYIAQLGFNGIEFGAEGPLPFEKSSMIVNYRYSFLDLLNSMGFDFNTSGIPRFQDGMVKLDVAAGSRDFFSFTGLFGISAIEIEDRIADDDETPTTGDFNFDINTDIITLGMNWKHLFSDKVYGNLLVGNVYNNYDRQFDSLTAFNDEITARTLWRSENSVEGYATARYELFYSASRRHFFSAGFETRYRYFDIDNRRYTVDADSETGMPFSSQASGNTIQTLSYANWNWRVTEDLTANIGVHSQYLEISDKATFEPRASLAYNISDRHSVFGGVGVYRQSQPLTVYFSDPANESLDFTQAIHYILGYSFQPSNDWLLKSEAYVKEYSKAGIDRDRATSFSLLNAGASFDAIDSDEPLTSAGDGKTYGVELSATKSFSDGYYITGAGSLVRQEFRGSDGVWRFGSFDNQYILNILAGYEWELSPSFTIEFSGKFTRAGGAPYTPVDIDLSRSSNSTFFDEDNPFSVRNSAYSKVDFRINFRQNFLNSSLISFIMVDNAFDSDNVLARQFNFRTGQVEEILHLGLFPVVGFRYEF